MLASQNVVGIIDSGSACVGTGFFLSQNYLVTAFHVYRDYKTDYGTLKYKTADEKEFFSLYLYAGDEFSDIAVLLLNKENSGYPEKSAAFELGKMPEKVDYNEEIEFWSASYPEGFDYPLPSIGKITAVFTESGNRKTLVVEGGQNLSDGSSGAPIIYGGRIVLGVLTKVAKFKQGRATDAATCSAIENVKTDLPPTFTWRNISTTKRLDSFNYAFINLSDVVLSR
jgi:hypothetical protein